MTISNNSFPRGLAAAVALILGTSAAQAKDVYLEAREYIPASGALAGIPMWGYAECTALFADCTAAATSPGPVIAVPADDAAGLTIHLRNALPEATSIHLLSQRNAPLPENADSLRDANGRLHAFVSEVAPGATGVYSWASGELRPGTYLYQSGSHVQLQVQMGLYGAVVHNAADASCSLPPCAYPSVPYTASKVMLFSEVDPALHSPPTPVNASVHGYAPRILLINGYASAGSALPAVTAVAGERVLLRLINAGLKNHAPQLLGGYFDVVAEDGYPAPVVRSQTATLLAASKTVDVLFAPTSSGTYGFVDRMARTDATGPAAPDTFPDPFSFTDLTGAALSTLFTSNAVTISGIDAPAPISVTGGQYSVGVGPFTAAPGLVNNADTVRVQQTSAATAATATYTVLDVGGVTDTFTVTTAGALPDTVPDPFSFTDQTNVALSTLITSNAVTINGIDSPTPISVTGGLYSVGAGAFTASPGVVNSAESVRVQLTSAATPLTATDAVLDVGGVTDTFTVTTAAAAGPNPVANPDVFYITANNNPTGNANFPSPGVLANDTDPQNDALRVKVGSVVPTIPAGATLVVNTTTGLNKGRVQFHAPTTSWVGDAYFSYIASEAVTAAHLDSAPAIGHVVHDQHMTLTRFHNPAGTASDRWDLIGEVRGLPSATSITVSFVQNTANTNCTRVGEVIANVPVASSATPTTWTYGGNMANPGGCNRIRIEVAIPAANGVPAHMATYDTNFQRVNP